MSEEQPVPPIIHPDALWDLEAIALWMRCGETNARKLVAQDGFPPAVRPLGPSSYPRWWAGEVIAFVRQQRAA